MGTTTPTTPLATSPRSPMTALPLTLTLSVLDTEWSATQLPTPLPMLCLAPSPLPTLLPLDMVLLADTVLLDTVLLADTVLLDAVLLADTVLLDTVLLADTVL